MNPLAHFGTRLSASLCMIASWSLLIGGCNDSSTATDPRDASSGVTDARVAVDGGDHDATAATQADGGTLDAATDAAADACVPESPDDISGRCANQHCTGPLGTSASKHTFVPGGNCRFISPEGFIEGSCVGGKMHFRDQATAGGPWIEYWDEHGRYVAEDFSSDVLEFCGDTAFRIVRGDAAAAAACEASRTDEHTVCSDADAGL